MASSDNSADGGRTFMRTSAGVADRAPPLAAGARLGPWAVEAPIASGGMGQVYRARRADGVYDQAVALKLIHDNDPVRVDRFGAERQRLAEMDHPGIARIIDGGTHEDGRPWMAMELVEGAPSCRRLPPCRARTACDCSSRFARQSRTPMVASCCTGTSNPRTCCWIRAARFA